MSNENFTEKLTISSIFEDAQEEPNIAEPKLQDIENNESVDTAEIQNMSKIGGFGAHGYQSIGRLSAANQSVEHSVSVPIRKEL